MKFFFLLITIFYLESCTKTEVVTNTAEPGNIKGKVTLYDTTGVIMPDASGMQVALENTKYSTVTAADGSWELSNVPAGAYSYLVYSKAGFPTYKSSQSQFGAFVVAGGGTQNDGQYNFYQIGNISVDLVIRDFTDFQQIITRDTVINSVLRNISDTIDYPQGQSIFTANILDVPKNKFYDFYGALYFGLTDSIVPSDPKTFLYSTAYTTDLRQTDYITGSCNFIITTPVLKSAGFKSHQTVYCVAYFGTPYVLYNTYYDYDTGMKIYPGFSPNHSEIKTFILP